MYIIDVLESFVGQMKYMAFLQHVFIEQISVQIKTFQVKIYIIQNKLNIFHFKVKNL